MAAPREVALSILKLGVGAVLACLPLGAQTPRGDRAIRVMPALRAPQGEPRVALVIGNGAYAASPLKNPVHDARAMAAALQQCGFTVIAMENASYQKMREGLRDFGGRIAQGGVGLFYFAGHGMQVKGRNYLIPIGADIADEDEVAGAALDVDAVLGKLETARNRLNILILDACRNNPFGRSFRGGPSGLAPLDAPAGTYIAFATAPGRTAADGARNNGLYTEQLLSAMATPGVKLEDTFKRVLTGVRKGSNDQQVPWTSSSVEGDFYFVPGAALPAPAQRPPAPASSSADQDLAVWNSIKEAGTLDEFQAYLDRFPDGIFAKAAANRIAALRAAAEEEALAQQSLEPAQALNLAEVLLQARLALGGGVSLGAAPGASLGIAGLLGSAVRGAATRQREGTRCAFDLLIDANGAVLDLKVIQCQADVEVWTQAARRLRFAPARLRDGKAVKVWQAVLLSKPAADASVLPPDPRWVR